MKRFYRKGDNVNSQQIHRVSQIIEQTFKAFPEADLYAGINRFIYGSNDHDWVRYLKHQIPNWATLDINLLKQLIIELHRESKKMTVTITSYTLFKGYWFGRCVFSRRNANCLIDIGNGENTPASASAIGSKGPFIGEYLLLPEKYHAKLMSLRLSHAFEKRQHHERVK